MVFGVFDADGMILSKTLDHSSYRGTINRIKNKQHSQTQITLYHLNLGVNYLDDREYDKTHDFMGR